MSALDYDRTTLEANDFSYERQLAALEADGWELEQHEGGGNQRYLRRHRDIEDIKRSVQERGQKLHFVHEDDGTWSAVVRPASIPGTSTADLAASGVTPLEAATAARAILESSSNG
jgi:hypothetical protein